MSHTVSFVHSTTDGDELLAYMARVSNPNAKQGDPSAKLINYLITHKHWSPFEMVSLCVEINTTRSVAAQILRHRSFSFQEFSQRYAQVTKPAVLPQLRRQDTKNRQNSIDDLSKIKVWFFRLLIRGLYFASLTLYKLLLWAGVAKECARDVLPLGTPTKLYMSGTLRSWIHYINLRFANGTQLEHQLIANQVKDIVKLRYPEAYMAVWGVEK